MVNSNLLRGRMVACGYNQKTLAAELRMSENALSLKIRGITAFTLDEVARICELFRLETPAEKCEIFLP